MFDVLNPATPIDRHLVIEASAGTGKTFSIQHLVIRNVLRGLKLSEILVVTFTKASTKELKERILGQLREIAAGSFPPYFDPEKKGCIEAALREFDGCEIDTIHAFANRMLSTYAFEANLFVDEAAEGSVEGDRTQAVRDFLRTDLEGLSYGLSQKKVLLSMKWEKPPAEVEGPFLTFDELYHKFLKIAFPPHLELAGEFGEALERAVDNPSPETFDQLLFLGVPEFKKKEKIPDYLAEVVKLVEYALSEEILANRFWRDVTPLVRKRGLQRGRFGFDEMLLGMQEALQSEAFKQAVAGRYRAVLIDEFQDTDPVQWNIFSTLFLHGWEGVLYLVGDPKQSIYRFRHADIYTYLQACAELGDEAKVALDTNYRSHPDLIDSLNAFLATDRLIPLPKLHTALPYVPVCAGRSDPREGANRIDLFEGESLEAVLNDMSALIQKKGCAGCAVLVKGKHQGKQVSDFFKECGIPHFFLKREEWKGHPAILQLKLFVQALFFPEDLHRLKALLGSPLGGYTAAELATAPYPELIAQLQACQKRGLFAAFTSFFKEPVPDQELYFKLIDRAQHSPNPDLFFDRLYLGLEKEEESLFNPKEMEGDGVAICTIHMSKGLEFDHVFALGLAAPQEKTADPEQEAEWMRQLYVAVTRARESLYIPSYPLRAGRSILSYYPHQFSTRQVGLIADPQFRCAKVAPPAAPIPQTTYRKKEHWIHSYTSLKGAEEPLHLEPLPEGGLPRGKEVGILLHSLLERIPYQSVDIAGWVERELQESFLSPFSKEVGQMFLHLFAYRFPPGFTLKEVDLVRELEFLFTLSPAAFTHDAREYLTGKMDALFTYGGKYYLIDWKSNWLESYEEQSLEEVMERFAYPLQAKIYEKALQLAVEKVEGGDFSSRFGGCFYIFLRGIPEGKGVKFYGN